MSDKKKKDKKKTDDLVDGKKDVGDIVWLHNPNNPVLGLSRSVAASPLKYSSIAAPMPSQVFSGIPNRGERSVPQRRAVSSSVVVQPAQVMMSQPRVIAQPQIISQPTVYQSGIVNTGANYVSGLQTSQLRESIKGETYVEYIPYEKSLIEYETIKKVEYVPYERRVTDYYTIEHQIEHVPQSRYEKKVEYVAEPRTEYVSQKKIEYVSQPRTEYITQRVVDYEQRKSVDYVPVERFERIPVDIEEQVAVDRIEYIPREYEENIAVERLEYRPVTRQEEIVDYVPVKRSIVRMPDGSTAPYNPGSASGLRLQSSGIGLGNYTTGVVPTTGIVGTSRAVPSTAGFIGASRAQPGFGYTSGFMGGNIRNYASIGGSRLVTGGGPIKIVDSLDKEKSK